MLDHYGAHWKASLAAAALVFTEGAVGFHVGGIQFKEQGSQHILERDNTRYSSRNQNNSANRFMGYGGALTLVNGSPFEWRLNSQTSYQMDTWKWPNVASGI